MNTSEIRDALNKQPFEPFSLRLADGRRLDVRHREFVAVSRRRVVVISADDESTSILEPLLIASIEYAGDGQGTSTDTDGSSAQ
jgi:hypothetical protein